MITKKIGVRTEYTESVRHCCGHTIDYVTLGYKMNRRQVVQKRQMPYRSRHSRREEGVSDERRKNDT
jgi:hypothetical protein